MDRSLQPRVPQRGTFLSSGRAWVTAALLVIAGSIALAFWLDHTATNVDMLRLERGAEAITRNLESEVRVVDMAASVIVAASVAADSPADFASIAVTADPVVLSSLVGLIRYPITDAGSGPGTIVFQVRPRERFDIPDLGLSPKVAEALVRENIPYMSPAYRVPGEDGVRLIAVVPAHQGDESVLVGAVFFADRILERAMGAIGHDEYAGQLLDRRFGDKVIVSVGTPYGSEAIRSSPVGMAGLIDVVVTAGSEFPYSRSPRTIGAVLGLGLVVASLLLYLAALTRSRTREMNEKLELARLHDEGKDRFLATVSHELRTPLTVVVGGANEVESQWDTLSAPERHELLGMVSEQAQEASNLVEDLLVVARSEYGNVKIAMAETHLQRHLDYAVSSVPLDRRGTLTVTDADPLVYADGTRLRQVLRNLIQNAVTHGGPNVAVEVSDDVEVVHISVLDDGDEVPAADRDRIFEPYARTDGAEVTATHGIGIGLYVSRLLAQMMGGELRCLRNGERTEFRLSLSSATADAISTHEPVSVP